ncbi:hypothetical protein J3E64_000697 [Sphingobium sp. OAS761]|uniref:hypothetical protein n=1 Tax=Sphingobium sp. OAS761 TaxID=2817901 RepID=UPI0020A15DC4|nr:hypothetical protein [Sphingobium sp. OAS761]MCP1469026.1 hypothetical protein [Sphingobium sp. OAS761]
MMVSPAGISISFGGTRGSDDDSRPVVARVFGFARDDEERPISHEMVVPAGQTVSQDLPQGMYNVQLTLPSGRILQRNVQINEDSNERYTFFEDFAPGAGFSLQETMGQADRSSLSRALSASGNSSSDEYFKALERASTIDSTTTSPLQSFRKGLRYWRTPAPASPLPAPPVHATMSLLRDPVLDMTQNDPPPSEADAIAPAELLGNGAMWRIASDRVASPDKHVRHWAHVTLPNGRVEVASLPLPWLCAASGTLSQATLLVDPARTDDAATRVAVDDAAMAGLLSFLDRGQANAAGPMLEMLERDDVIERVIRDGQNSLAACAAAYVGLAVYDPYEREIWDARLYDCMMRYPHVPDAAIVHARRAILRPQNSDDNGEAAEALRRACAAGIPYFSAGVPLLQEMLLLLSPDFPDLAPLAARAAQLAARTDLGQAFTVLRYAAPKEDRT